MSWLITFIEGIVSFLSPCMLPMLPLYLSYFAAGEDGEKRVGLRAASFCAGFTVVFTLLGALSGTLGTLLSEHRTLVNIVCGCVIILMGFSYLDILPLRFLKGMKPGRGAGSIGAAFVFGLVYSVNLTPCVGAFLGSALMLAASEGGALRGMELLLVYSLGISVPFLLSALLLSALRAGFAFIKRHYKFLNTVCGVLLILMGIAIMCGLMNRIG